MVTIGAPADLQHILRVFRPGDLDAIASEGEASVEIAGRPFLIRRTFLETVERADIEVHRRASTSGAGHAFAGGPSRGH